MQTQNVQPPEIEIATAALAGQGQYGVVSELAREHEISRQKVYGLRERARAVLAAEFEPEDEEAESTSVLEFTQADVERTIIAMRVSSPSSIRDIVSVLPVIYGRGYSYGKVQSILVGAELRAREMNAKADLSGIGHVALDEMFSQGRPVFGGIDMDAGYLFQLDVHESRGGEDWAKALGKLRDEQGLHPRTVVKDAGTGLAKGVKSCWPDVEENDDMFHAKLMMGRELYHLERRAYGAISREYELEAKSAKARNERQRRSIGQKLRKARKNASRAIEKFDRFEQLCAEAQRVLDLTDRGSGRLRTSAEVVSMLGRVADEMQQLNTSRIVKVAKYLRNRAVGLGRYLDDLRRRLEEVTDEAGGPEVVEAVVRAYQAGLVVRRGGPAWDRKAREQELGDASGHLIEVTGRDPERLGRALDLVISVLIKRYRASSAIENLNSVLRPYLVVQKCVQQGFLDLFRFYWNNRTREWGRGKGTSAHEQLTGEKVDDWLTMLGYPPSDAFSSAS